MNGSRHNPTSFAPGTARGESFLALRRNNKWRVMEIISLAKGKGAPSRPWRPALLLLLGLALALTAACGGGGETTESPQGTARPSSSPSTGAAASPQPSGTAAAAPWATVRQVIQRFVPDSTAFKAYIPRITDVDRPNVDLSITPAFVSGKLHIIQFSGRGETLFGKYKDFDVYKLEETPWAKLSDGEPPLWVGSPNEDVLHDYLDFFATGKPALTNERFWNAFAYAEATIDAALGDDVALLQIDFDDAWDRGGLEAGGIRIEATQGNRHAYVGVLYAASDSGLDGTALVERLGEDFRLQFAVPSGSAEESETREWGYPNHIWFVQWETVQ